MAVQVAETRVTVGGHTQLLIEHSKDIKNLYKALSYRLPLWATFLLSAQTFAIGWLVKGVY